MNATSSEQWEFDGVSEDGLQSFIFGFYRDPNYSFVGTGNLRVYFEMVGLVPTIDSGKESLQDKRYAVVDYAESSLVEECTILPSTGSGPEKKVTRGTWQGRDFVYQFEIDHDLRHARVTMQNPDVDVAVVLHHRRRTSFLRSYYDPSSSAKEEDDGGENEEEKRSLVAVPHFYWVEAIPVAVADFSAVFHGGPDSTATSGATTTIAWHGMGGHERLWAAFNWYTCLAGMVAVRAQVGPFALSYIEFSSGIQDGLVMQSVSLTEQQGEDQELADVFIVNKKMRQVSPKRSSGDQEEEDDDYFKVRKLYAGDLQGVPTEALKDKVTGIELVLESPRRGNKTWKFVLEHKKVGFEYVLGEGVGGTGYSGIARGGLVGKDIKQWEGPAFSEVMRFPKKSWLLHKNLNY